MPGDKSLTTRRHCHSSDRIRITRENQIVKVKAHTTFDVNAVLSKFAVTVEGAVAYTDPRHYITDTTQGRTRTCSVLILMLYRSSQARAKTFLRRASPVSFSTMFCVPLPRYWSGVRPDCLRSLST